MRGVASAVPVTTISESDRKCNFPGSYIPVTEKNTTPWSAGRYSDPPDCRRTSEAAAVSRANPRYRNSLEEAAAESPSHCSFPGLVCCGKGVWAVVWGLLPGAAAGEGVVEAPDNSLRGAPEGALVAPVGVSPGSDFSARSHRAVGCSGYTWFHLPVRSCKPPELRKEEANFAILAARMAFSSFAIRSAAR